MFVECKVASPSPHSIQRLERESSIVQIDTQLIRKISNVSESLDFVGQWLFLCVNSVGSVVR